MKPLRIRVIRDATNEARSMRQVYRFSHTFFPSQRL